MFNLAGPPMKQISPAFRRCVKTRHPLGKDLRLIRASWLASLPALLTIFGCFSYSQGGDDQRFHMERALARAQSAALDRHHSEAIKILKAALQQYPEGEALQLELGRLYLATGKDGQAQQLFSQILKKNPTNRDAELELARTLAYQQRYERSDQFYRQLLAQNSSDEAAAIGLTSNLIHQRKTNEAAEVADSALRYHPNSLRLLEFKDRIVSGRFGGDERSAPFGANVLSSSADYFNDSAGNHSWRATDGLELSVRPGLTTDLHLEQQFLHSLDDSREVVETFSQAVRWRPLERFAISAGGGAIHFDRGDVRAIYEATLTGQPASHLLLGAAFSRVPVVPDAEAAEHQLTAQGWEGFAVWTPAHWQLNLRATRRHYTDENVGEQEWIEALHHWTAPKVDYIAGCRFRRYTFRQDVAHGYFSPDNYRSYQAAFGASFHPGRRYRGEITTRIGAESIASGADFQAAWEITARNQLTAGHWELNLDYSRYHMAQVTGAFKANAARFEFAYRF